MKRIIVKIICVLFWLALLAFGIMLDVISPIFRELTKGYTVPALLICVAAGCIFTCFCRKNGKSIKSFAISW